MAITPRTDLHKRSFAEPDELQPAGRGRGEIVLVNDVSLSRISLEPGWRWSTDVQPITHTHSCQAAHTGVVLSGRIHLRMDDGSEMEFGAGDAYHIPPGHDAWVVGDEPYVGLDVVRENIWARPA